MSEKQPERSGFEAEFELTALGDDLTARVDRVEAFLAGILQAGLNQGPDNFTTSPYNIGQTLPVLRPEAVENLLDQFRDPAEVTERIQWEQDNPEANP